MNNAHLDRQLTLYKILRQLSSELDVDRIIHRAVQAMQQLQRWQSISISLPSADGDSWQTRAADLEPTEAARPVVSMHHGVIGRAYRTGAVQHVPNVHHDPDFFQAEGVQPINSELAVPILFDQQVLGVINLESDQFDAFTADDIAFAQSIAELLAIALKNAQRFAAIQRESAERAAIEAALRQSEDRYRLLFTTMTQGVVYQAADGSIIDANPAAERVLGLTLDQLQGRTSRDPRWSASRADGSPFPGDEHPSMIALRTGKPVMQTIMQIFNPRTQQKHWLSINATPLFQPGSAHPYQVYTTFEDITERRRAELALRSSEELYRGLIRSLDNSIIVIDNDGAIRYINDVTAHHLSLSAQDVIGRTLFDFAEPSVAATQLAHIRQVISTDHAIVAEVPNLFLQHMRWYRLSIQPLHDEHGRAVSALVNATDIHDLKTAEQELLQLNDTLEKRIANRTAEIQDLYDNAPTGYHSLDADGRITRINQIHLDWLGYTHAELIGKPFSAVLAEASRTLFMDHFAHLKAHGTLADAEYELVRKDGTSFPVIYNATALSNDRGEFVLSRSTLLDHTERKKAEAAIQQANADMERALRTKDEFLANMSHELRTPLNAILALSESLREGVRGTLLAAQYDSLKQIEASGYHLLALINDILDLSKVEAGRLELQCERLSIADICRASVQLVREMALKKQLSLSFTLDDALGDIEADARRLKQILVNLLSNAIKFTPAGGRVKLEVARDRLTDTVAFTVHDTGIGIAADDMQYLFRPFTQLDSSLSRRHEGTGLGLALVRRLAQLHGGDITVRSAPGIGSSFTVTLPQRDSAVTPAPEPEAATAQHSSYARTALIVEDAISAAEQLTRYLHELQIRTVIHPQGAAIVESAAAIKPNVILLDLLMPQQSGWEMLEQLKADPRTRTIPVIIVTIVDERRAGLAAGAADYLVKPISRESLRSALTHVIGVAPAAQPAEPQLQGEARVLLAEDNEVNLNVIRDYLQSKGYQLAIARNGVEALEQAALYQPQLIIMDIQMPHMDGLEAMRRLREDVRFATTPMIALTALAMASDRERCLAAGANAYLSKPVSLRDLATMVTDLLAQTSA